MKRIFLSFFCFLVLTVAILDLAFSPLMTRVVEHYLQNQIETYYRTLVKGVFYMVRVDLNRYPQSQWSDRMATIAPNFGYPLSLKPLAGIDLNTAGHRQLASNMIVVHQDSEMFYQQLDGSQWVVALGPVADPEADMVWLDFIIWAAVIVVVGVLTLMWALPFGRKLHKISTAALAFGNGQLESRANVPKRSILAPLANAFNRMAERIQQLINSQKELTNAVSHELRTPISRIRFSLEMLDGAASVADRKHYLSEINKDVDELNDLVTESLTYARFEHSTPRLEWSPCVLEPWVQQIVLTVPKGSLNIEIRIKNSLSMPDREVYLEPRYMHRALLNLIQNAVSHANRRVEITLAEEGDTCQIHVDDDGAGIPEPDRIRVFQAFTRLDASRSRESGGYGLGLAIVHRVAAWHGGDVGVSQAPLGGARLTICWPGFEPTPIINRSVDNHTT